VVLGSGFFVTLAYGLVGFHLLGHHLGTDPGLLNALKQTVQVFVPWPLGGTQVVTAVPRLFAASVYMFGVAALGCALTMLLRPVPNRQATTTAQSERASSIVEAHGRTPAALRALREGYSCYFSPGGSLVAYTLTGRVALALGDPIGPAGDAGAAILGFRDVCVRNNWLPTFCPTLPDHLDQYRAAGLRSIQVGAEEYVDLHQSAPPAAALGAPGRLVELGHRTVLYEPPLPDALLAALQAVSHDWPNIESTGRVHSPDGWLADGSLADCQVIVVYTPQGEASAFASVTTGERRAELALDYVRHRRDMEEGTVGLLVDSLARWASGEGYQGLSLGLGRVSANSADLNGSVLKRTVASAGKRLCRPDGRGSLLDFPTDLETRSEPRYLVFPGWLDLPLIAIALSRARRRQRRH
jgi:phosphatidylglycerol lysyltransferase